MSLTLAPVVALIVLTLLSPSHKASENDKKISRQSAVDKKAIVIQKASNNNEKDYGAILAFIQKKYRHIKQEDAKQISKYLVEYGNLHQVDPKFAAAVIARESSFNKKAISRTGAKGLGQIKDFNFNMLKIKDPFNIQQNVGGTTQYLRKMLNKWQDQIDKGPQSKNHPVQPESQIQKVRLALASYYKGFTNVNKDGGKLDQKTKGYVDDIFAYYDAIMKETYATSK